VVLPHYLAVEVELVLLLQRGPRAVVVTICPVQLPTLVTRRAVVVLPQDLAAVAEIQIEGPGGGADPDRAAAVSRRATADGGAAHGPRRGRPGSCCCASSGPGGTI
jgi:hypothetical protein